MLPEPSLRLGKIGCNCNYNSSRIERAGRFFRVPARKEEYEEPRRWQVELCNAGDFKFFGYLHFLCWLSSCAHLHVGRCLLASINSVAAACLFRVGCCSISYRQQQQHRPSVMCVIKFFSGWIKLFISAGSCHFCDGVILRWFSS